MTAPLESPYLLLAAPLLLLALAAPTIIAYARRSPDRRTILGLNVAGLIAFSAWAAALAWALLGRRDASLVEGLRSRGLLPPAIAAIVFLIAASLALTIATLRR